MKTRTNIYFFLPICVAVIFSAAVASMQASSTDIGKMLQAELHNPSLWALNIASILFVILAFWTGSALRKQEQENQRLQAEQQKLRELDAQRSDELLAKIAAQDEQFKLMLNKLDVVEGEIQRNSETALLPISDRTNSLQRQMEAVHLALQYQRGDLQQVRHALRAIPVTNLLSTESELAPYAMSITSAKDEETDTIEPSYTEEINLSFSEPEPEEEYVKNVEYGTEDTPSPQLSYFHDETSLETPSLESAVYMPEAIEMTADEHEIEDLYSITKTDPVAVHPSNENDLVAEYQFEHATNSQIETGYSEQEEVYNPIDNLTADDISLMNATEVFNSRDQEATESAYSTAPVEEALATDIFPSWYRELLSDSEIEEPVIPMEEVSSIYDEYFESQEERLDSDAIEIENTTSSLLEKNDLENDAVPSPSEDDEYIISHDASEWSANDPSTIVMPPISLQMDSEIENAMYPPHHDVLYSTDQTLKSLSEEDDERTPLTVTGLQPATLTAEEMNLLTAPLPNPEEQELASDENARVKSEETGRTGWHRKL